MNGPSNIPPRLMTIKEVAGLANVSSRTVRRWIDAGQLPFYRLGRAIRISDEDVRNMLERCKQ